MAQNKNKDILTIPQAAQYCAVDRVTMWRWIKAGNIKVSVTPGGHHRILNEDLESFLADQGMYPLARRYFPKKKILIVDDDLTTREAFSEFFSVHGYVTSVAANGFTAGLQIMRLKPDLVLLDLMMPGIDGFEVCSLIKENSETSHIIVLVLTGYDTEENRERILKAGADGFLSKPVEQDTILRNVKDLLDRKEVI